MAPKKDKQTGLNQKYVPKSLTKADKAKQVKSIKEGKERPKVKSVKSKESKWTTKAKSYFDGNTSISNISKKTGVSTTGLNKIIKKGQGAYYSSGSRPNQTPQSWGKARLYSVLFGGNARSVDKDIVKEYKIPLLR